MDKNQNAGQMNNGQKIVPQAQGNKSFYKTENFRKGALMGAAGGVVLAELTRYGVVKLINWVKKRREERKQAAEPKPEK